MKVYKTGKYDNYIEEKEITKATVNYIFYPNWNGEKEDREAKVTQYSIWHDSKENAIAYLEELWLNKIEAANKEIEDLNKKLKELNELKNNNQQ